MSLSLEFGRLLITAGLSRFLTFTIGVVVCYILASLQFVALSGVSMGEGMDHTCHVQGCKWRTTKH